MNILKVHIANVKSAMKISELLCEHDKSKKILPDHIIAGLIYRLIIPMESDDMNDSLNFANKLFNDIENDNLSDDSDDSDDIDDSDEEKFDEEKLIEKKIKRYTCNCKICQNTNECLDKFINFETFEPLVSKFKDSIIHTCEKYNRII